MLNTFAQSVIRWRWAIIFFTFLWVGLAASGMRHLGFTTDYRVFFSADNPQMMDFDALQNTYDKSDNILFIITPQDGEVFTQQTLASVEWLTEQAWQIPYSIRVDSITNFQHTRARGDDLEVAPLVENANQQSGLDLEQVRTIALDEPSLYQRLINDETTVTGINITVQLPGNSPDEVPEAAQFARNLAEQLRQQNSNLTVGLSGMVMFNNAFGENAKGDMGKLVPLMFLVIILGLGLLLRSVSATVGSTLVIFLSILAGMGVFGWSGYKISPPSASAPNIILTMAVADSVHFLLTFLFVLRGGTGHANAQAITKVEAIVESLRINVQPIFITSVTTVLGFLALNFSEVPPLVHLGNVVAVGVTAAFILSLTFLPALMAVLPIKVSANVKNTPTQADGLATKGQVHFGFVPNFLERFGDWVIVKRRGLLWGGALLTLVLLSQIPRNEFNDDYVKYFDPRTEFRQDTDYAIEHLLGPNRIEYSLDSGREAGVSAPTFLEDVQRFVDYLQSQDEVVHVSSVLDTLKRLNKNLHGDNSDWYRLPDTQALAAQYLLLYEMSLPYGLDLNHQINVSKSATRVVVTFDAMTTAQMLALETRFDRWLLDNTPDLQAKAASSNLMFSHIGQRNTRSMLTGAALALVGISLLLMLTFRSVKLGLISLIPNLIPVAMAFGLWGLMVGQVGLSLAPVVAMTLGIVVDDTVHFLSKYLRARREKGFDAPQAVHYALNTVGPAMIVTTLVLVAGFLILTLSNFKLNTDMGLLTAVTFAIALLVDFLLLPPLLILVDGTDNDSENDNDLVKRIDDKSTETTAEQAFNLPQGTHARV